MNLPLNVGIIGTVLAPWAVLAGVLAAFGTKCVIELVKDDGEIIDISEIASDTFDEVVEKGSVLADEVKTKGVDVFASVKSKASEALIELKLLMMAAAVELKKNVSKIVLAEAQNDKYYRRKRR